MYEAEARVSVAEDVCFAGGLSDTCQYIYIFLSILDMCRVDVSNRMYRYWNHPVLFVYCYRICFLVAIVYRGLYLLSSWLLPVWESMHHLMWTEIRSVDDRGGSVVAVVFEGS